MKIIIKNADFTLANAKYRFMALENGDVLSSKLLLYYNGESNANSSYRVLEYSVPVNATAIRINGTFVNTAAVSFIDAAGNVIDTVSKGQVVTYALENELRFIPIGTVKIRVCHNIASPGYEQPIVEYTTDDIAGQIFKLGTIKKGSALLTYNTGVLNYPFGGYSVVLSNVEGMSKVYVTGNAYKNCCALVFFADKELTQVVEIAYNNNATLGEYSLENAEAVVPIGAKYAATCFPDSSGSEIASFMKVVK